MVGHSLLLLFYGGVAIFLLQITGGSSGIGKCLAAEAILKGASLVCLVARNKVRKTPSVKE